MIIFENDGEIDPRLAMLIGVNVKENTNAIGFFGTGLKYAIACLSRWNETITLQSGLAEFTFSCENVNIRNKEFGIISLCGKYDRTQLGFTTELGKHWEPWMVYRELWSNAKDEPGTFICESTRKPEPTAGITRVIVSGTKIEGAHKARNEFLLENRVPIVKTDGLEIHAGEGQHIFYRNIAIQHLSKPSLFTYNITEQLYLTEDRTAGSWSTDPIIVRNLAALDNEPILETTLSASDTNMEARLDYDYIYSDRSQTWTKIAQRLAQDKPLSVHSSVRKLFNKEDEIKVCPTCRRPL
jgi:hypothetical protein